MRNGTRPIKGEVFRQSEYSLPMWKMLLLEVLGFIDIYIYPPTDQTTKQTWEN